MVPSMEGIFFTTEWRYETFYDQNGISKKGNNSKYYLGSDGAIVDIFLSIDGGIWGFISITAS